MADNASTTTNDADFFDAGTTTATYSIIENASGNTVEGSTTSPAAGPNFNYVGVTDAQVQLNPTLQTASNGTVYLNFTGTSIAFAAGSNPNNLTKDQAGGPRVDKNGNIDIGSIETLSNVSSGIQMVLASGKNGYVEVINASTHAIIQNFQPFAGYTGTVSVALGTLDGAGTTPDIILGAKGMVKVYDGASALVPGVYLGVPSSWARLLLPTGTGLKDTRG